jgi:hypothetical protein
MEEVDVENLLRWEADGWRERRAWFWGSEERGVCVCVSTKSLDQYIYTQKDTLGHQQLYTAHNLSDSSVLFIPTVPVQNITTHTEGAIVLG